MGQIDIVIVKFIRRHEIATPKHFFGISEVIHVYVNYFTNQLFSLYSWLPSQWFVIFYECDNLKSSFAVAQSVSPNPNLGILITTISFQWKRDLNVRYISHNCCRSPFSLCCRFVGSAAPLSPHWRRFRRRISTRSSLRGWWGRYSLRTAWIKMQTLTGVRCLTSSALLKWTLLVSFIQNPGSK